MRFPILPISIVVSLGVGVIIGYGLKPSPNRSLIEPTTAPGAPASVSDAIATLAADPSKLDPTALDDVTLDGLIEKWTAIHAAMLPELAKFKSAHEIFQIQGKIQDRDENNVMVYGRAFNTDIDERNLGQHFQETSILVEGYASQGLSGFYYTGKHFFLERREGKNSLGAAVPLYVYGAEPPYLAKANAFLAKLEQLQREKAKRSASKPPSK